VCVGATQPTVASARSLRVWRVETVLSARGCDVTVLLASAFLLPRPSSSSLSSPAPHQLRHTPASKGLASYSRGTPRPREKITTLDLEPGAGGAVASISLSMPMGVRRVASASLDVRRRLARRAAS
jgi:hypothetical protein